MSLCKYKDSLGKPKEGIHSYRFLGIAIADFLLTIVLAASNNIVKYSKKYLNISYYENVIGGLPSPLSPYRLYPPGIVGRKS